MHNLRAHPHYQPPGKEFVVTAQEIYLRDRAFYNMLVDVARYVLYIALVLIMINSLHSHDVFLRNYSVYRQVFLDPQFQSVRTNVITKPWDRACMVSK